MASAPPVRSAGCDVDPGERTSVQKVSIGDRFYLVSTPGGDPDTPKPVVLDLHGLLEGAEIHSRMSGFGPYAQEHGFIAVFPHGSGNPVGWNVNLDRQANPDLVYLDAVLDQVEAQHCVDTSRVYATGLSYGAIMSSTLGCVMTDRIAAIAPVAGLTVPKACDPERPVPVLTFHGTVDPILLFNGGVANLGNLTGGGGEKTEPPEADLDGPGYPAAAATWAEMNGCTGDPKDRDLTASVIQRTWTCPAGSPVVFDIEVGSGHSWPGSEFSKGIGSIVGPTDESIDGTDLIWTFFQRFALPPT
ncbi:MAG: alpha/beta hydrolase family protein [Acidimicrobiales bacterium]|nr:alpha/beta hydrolase family protein [Acidimicrobiales bacterium]